MTLRWGIIGAGRISSDFVNGIAVIPKEEGHQVVAVASQTAAKAKEFAEKFQIPKTYDSYLEIIKDPDVDVLYLGNLITQRYEIAKLALNHKKPILTEKPLSVNAALSQELIQCAQTNKVFMMEALWSRCFPAYDHLRKLLADKTLGDVYYIRVDFGYDLSDKETMSSAQYCCGSLIDMGVYGLQLQQLVFGGDTPTKIVASGHVNAGGVDRSATTLMTFSGGRTGVVTSNIHMELPNEALIAGSKGYVKIPFFWCPDTLILSTGETLQFPLPDTEGRTFNYPHSVGLNYEAREVKRCLENGLLESPKITFKDTLQLANLMDTCRKQLGVVYPQDK